ncbi:MAG TPA: 3-phosphoshikimate 1-carboxyvinyltransferase [Ferruginibacter sp.]|nr:3-phosphoshikimate 1-carboxyvinyltransferase [Ferruginibacter sp.]
MTVSVHPSSLSGTVKAPASKSSMQRACALALLHEGETMILNPGKSNDDIAALDIIQRLGASIEIQNEKVKIKNGESVFSGAEINCGESGLGIRMFTPIAALSSKEIIINGSGSLLKRPMHFFDEIFPKLGISIQSNNGYLPIKIKGPLQPADITINGSLSSQFLTGLLMAYGKAATKPVTITVNNLKSKPYIDLTLQMMGSFGYDVVNNNYASFAIKPITGLTNKQINCIIEGDWSGAAFLLVAGAVAGNVVVKGLDIHSAQADKAILNALKDCGAEISAAEGTVTVNSFPGGLGNAFYFNATDCPDLFPPLVVLAAYCKGISVIEGVSRLQHKESNRAITLQQEFGKMGVEIKLEADKMMIAGGNSLKGARVHSHHDHRIAMACAAAALKANGETVIEEAEAVNKSYPGFYNDLKLLGAAVSLPITN